MGSSINEISIMQNCAGISLWSYWDMDLVCRFANKEFFKWCGKTPEELLGIISLRVLFNGSYHEHHLPYVNKVLGGQVQKYNSEIKLINGQKCSVTIIYYPDVENGSVEVSLPTFIIKTYQVRGMRNCWMINLILIMKQCWVMIQQVIRAIRLRIILVP